MAKKTLRQKIAERTGGGLTLAQRARVIKGVEAFKVARKDQGLKTTPAMVSKKRGEFERQVKRA